MLSAKAGQLPLGCWILVIADDLTGALEVGAKFANHGLTVRVTTEVSVAALPDVEVLVIDTESRHLPPVDAASVVYQAAIEASRFSPWLIYKKTDSTLRGNIAAEFRAIWRVFPDRRLIYGPAYPAMGCTVKNGRLLLWGTPVDKTVFAADRWNAVQESNIKVLLDDVPVLVLDGESSADLREAARLVMSSGAPRLAAGPAALAEALAECCCAANERESHWPSLVRCLVVNGSLHPISAAQIAFAREHALFDENWKYFNCDVRRSGLERAAETGACVRRFLESVPIDALIVFGGDTASGIHRALDAPPFEPHGEVVQGVPLSSCGGMFWITKAGGFGERDILLRIRRRLT